MNKIAKKLQIGTAAGAMAAAATLMPLPAGQLPAAQAQATPGLGSSLGSITCLFGIGDDCESGPTNFGSAFYFGPRDETPPDRSDFLILHPAVPLALIPVLGPALSGWFATLNLEVCVAGLSARIGPYGTVTASLGESC